MHSMAAAERLINDVMFDYRLLMPVKPYVPTHNWVEEGF